MNLRRPSILAFVLIAASAVVGVWAWRLLPPGAAIPVHFNPHGDPDGFLPKTTGLVLMPVIGALVVAVLATAPRWVVRDPEGLAQSQGAYGVVLIGVAAMFLVAQGAIAMHAMDPRFDVLRWLFLAIGVLFVVVGNLAGKIRYNQLFGVRTPWTLRDRRVWDKTHRFFGRLMVLAGVALAGAAYFAGADHTDLIAALVVCAAAPGIVAIVYSRAISQAPAEG